MKKSQGGFTLIELIIVVALLALSIGLTNDILLSLIRANTKTQVMNEIEQQANFVSLKLTKELRDAKSAQIVDAQNLRFTLRSGTILVYSVDTSSGYGYITRQIEPDPAQILTSNSSPGGVNVSCIGECFSITGSSPQVVNIKMKFSQAQSGESFTSYAGSSNIDTSVVIRNTY